MKKMKRITGILLSMALVLGGMSVVSMTSQAYVPMVTYTYLADGLTGTTPIIVHNVTWDEDEEAAYFAGGAGHSENGSYIDIPGLFTDTGCTDGFDISFSAKADTSIDDYTRFFSINNGFVSNSTEQFEFWAKSGSYHSWYTLDCQLRRGTNGQDSGVKFFTLEPSSPVNTNDLFSWHTYRIKVEPEGVSQYRDDQLIAYRVRELGGEGNIEDILTPYLDMIDSDWNLWVGQTAYGDNSYFKGWIKNFSITFKDTHVHSFSASANGATVTAGCTESGCTMTEYPSFTIVAPALTTYGGSGDAEATLSGVDTFNTVTGKNVTAADIKYIGRDGTVYEENATAPVNPGKYTAKITVDGQTASVDYEITGVLPGETNSGSSSDNQGLAASSNADTEAKVPYMDVAISTGSVKDITGTAAATAEKNPFSTKIVNNSNDELKTLLSLTDNEVNEGVNVWLDIQDMGSRISQTEKDLVQSASGDHPVAIYLDINLFKKVGSNEATKITATNGKIKASIVIPESLRKSGRSFEIIRVHGGETTVIPGVYDENTYIFTFETDKFSTYALAYIENNNSRRTNPPKTEDTTDAGLWFLLFAVSVCSMGVVVYKKKKL